ncbi:MAG: hypothetical protein C4345_07030, partial [Chloroflexota bacterium]
QVFQGVPVAETTYCFQPLGSSEDRWAIVRARPGEALRQAEILPFGECTFSRMADARSLDPSYRECRRLLQVVEVDDGRTRRSGRRQVGQGQSLTAKPARVQGRVHIKEGLAMSKDSTRA